MIVFSNIIVRIEAKYKSPIRKLSKLDIRRTATRRPMFWSVNSSPALCRKNDVQYKRYLLPYLQTENYRRLSDLSTVYTINMGFKLMVDIKHSNDSPVIELIINSFVSLLIRRIDLSQIKGNFLSCFKNESPTINIFYLIHIFFVFNCNLKSLILLNTSLSKTN